MVKQDELKEWSNSTDVPQFPQLPPQKAVNLPFHRLLTFSAMLTD